MSEPASLKPTPLPSRRDRRPALRGAARLRPAADVLGTVASNAQRSRLPQMAAALAYRTLFGLIPVMVVALMGLKMFTPTEDIQGYVKQAMHYAGLDEIVVGDEDPASAPREALDYTWLVPVGASPVPRVLVPQEAVADGPGAEASDVPQETAAAPDPTRTADTTETTADETAQAPMPEALKPEGIVVESTGSARLDEWITGLVVRVSTIPVTTITAIGVLALIYAAISMLVEIERAFNQIYRVPLGRSWARRITNYWTLLTLGTVLLFATFYAGEKFKAWAAGLAQRGGLVAADASENAVSIRALGFAVTVCISTGLLLLAYSTVPNTRVRLRPAMAGAFIAALLWESGKWGFTLYAASATSYTRLYGSLAILPLFLLWVYVTWLVVLLGLQISYFLQFEQYRRAPVAADGPKVPAVADPALGAAVMAAAARAFRDGGTLTLAGIAGTVRAGEEAVRAVAGRLVERGLLRQVARAEGPEGYILGRPADLIPMTEVLEASYELVAPPAGQAPDPVLERLHRVQLDGVSGQTVASMIAEDPAPPAGQAAAAVHVPGHANGQHAKAAAGAPTSSAPAAQGPSAPATLPPVG